MKITTFEQSGLIITSENGQTLAIDIGALTPVASLTDTKVDNMLVSHIHADHCSVEQIIALQPQQVYTGTECIEQLAESGVQTVEITDGVEVKIGDFSVTPFEVDHGPNAPRVPAQNFGFLIKIDGKLIYFAGDMFTPSGITVNDIEADIVIVPVGGHFTLDAEAAFAFVQQFKSIGLIYPVHHEAIGQIDTNGHTKFAQLAEGIYEVVL